MKSRPLTRPRSIVWFQRLYLGAALAAFVVTMFYYGELRAWSVTNGAAPGMIMFSALLGLIASLAIWYFVVRRASPLAKWLLAGITAIHLVQLALEYPVHLEIGQGFLLAGIVISLAEVISCLLLFRADARAWSASRGVMAANPAVFE